MSLLFRENIKCPECGCVQDACVMDGGVFPVYIHECNECSFIIMESEWDAVKKEDAI